MKKTNKISNTADSLAENVHRHANWLEKLRKRAKKELTPKMFEMFTKYDEDLVMSAVASSTRHTALSKFLVVIGKYEIEDLPSITKEKVKNFDLVNTENKVVGDVKHYKTTAGGNRPSAKISILNEYVWIMQMLEKFEGVKWRKLFVVGEDMDILKNTLWNLRNG